MRHWTMPNVLKLSLDKITEVHGKNALLQDLQFQITTKFEGYVSSDLTYDYAAFYEGDYGTGYLSNVLEVDFPVTKRLEEQWLFPEGGTFNFGDYSITIPSGAVDTETGFSLTRIAHEQVKGNTNRLIRFGVRETELERFELHPSTLKLAKSASISFTPVDAIALTTKDEIVVSSLLKNNTWLESKNSHFKQGNRITFEAACGDTYRVHALYEDHVCTVLDDVRFIQPFETGDVLSNCDCGFAAKVSTNINKVKREDLLFENDISDELAYRILRQIRRTANIPAVSKNCVRKNNRFSFYTNSCATSITLDQCETGTLKVNQRVRLIRGNIYGQNFEYSYKYTFDTKLQTGQCPTTSACHQGC